MEDRKASEHLRFVPLKGSQLAGCGHPRPPAGLRRCLCYVVAGRRAFRPSMNCSACLVGPLIKGLGARSRLGVMGNGTTMPSEGELSTAKDLRADVESTLADADWIAVGLTWMRCPGLPNDPILGSALALHVMSVWKRFTGRSGMRHGTLNMAPSFRMSFNRNFIPLI